MTRGKVSIVTPTYGRERFLALAHRTVAAQTYSDFEWLVLDDSPAPSAYMQSLSDPRIRYRHTGERMKVGRKRNELVAATTGDIVVHFDDDDYYAPTYVERMARRLESGYDFVKLSGWYLYTVAQGAAAYWDTRRSVEANRFGYGFSYAYRRSVWERTPFPEDVHGGEDYPFARAARAAFRFADYRDVRGICLHVVHRNNMSRCFPQYRVPSFALRWIFPAALEDYLRE